MMNVTCGFTIPIPLDEVIIMKSMIEKYIAD